MKTTQCGLGARVFAALTIVAAIGACGDDADAPFALDDERLVLSLQTPNDDDGAVVFEIRGGAPEEPRALDPSHQVFVLPDAAREGPVRIALIGSGLRGALISFAVSDGARVGSYSADVLEVADEANELRAQLTGYSASLAPGGR